MCGFGCIWLCALVLGKDAHSMDAISENGNRPAGSGEKRGELPVLFHLMDVSRQRPAPRAQPQEPAVVPAPAPELAPCVVVLPSEPAATPILAPAPPALIGEPAPSLVEAFQYELPAPPAVGPDNAIAESSIADTIISAAIGTELPPADSAVDRPAEQHPVTPRSQTITARKPRTSSSEDWF